MTRLPEPLVPPLWWKQYYLDKAKAIGNDIELFTRGSITSTLQGAHDNGATIQELSEATKLGQATLLYLLHGTLPN